MNTTPYFPIFISLKGKKILLFGAGKVGQRRIASLLPFSPKITVVAKEISGHLYQNCMEDTKKLPEQYNPTDSRLAFQKRAYIPGEIQDYDFVLAATNDPEVNHAIYQECREKGIPVNNASCQEECDFFFPAIVQKEEMVIGLCSGGQNHKQVRETAALLRETAFPAAKPTL